MAPIPATNEHPAQATPTTSGGTKLGFGLSAFSLIFLVSLLMPWVTVSCSGTVLMKQSGLEVIYGGASKSEEMEKLPSSSKDSPSAKDAIPAWWLGFALIGALTAGVLGVRAGLGKGGQTKPAIAAAAIGALVLTGSLVAGLPIEGKLDDMRAEMKKSAKKKGGDGDEMGAAIAGAIRAERQSGVTVALTAVWGQLLFAIALEALSRGKLADARKKLGGAIAGGPTT